MFKWGVFIFATLVPRNFNVILEPATGCYLNFFGVVTEEMERYMKLSHPFLWSRILVWFRNPLCVFDLLYCALEREPKGPCGLECKHLAFLLLPVFQQLKDLFDTRHTCKGLSNPLWGPLIWGGMLWEKKPPRAVEIQGCRSTWLR